MGVLYSRGDPEYNLKSKYGLFARQIVFGSSVAEESCRVKLLIYIIIMSKHSGNIILKDQVLNSSRVRSWRLGKALLLLNMRFYTSRNVTKS